MANSKYQQTAKGNNERFQEKHKDWSGKYPPDGGVPKKGYQAKGNSKKRRGSKMAYKDTSVETSAEGNNDPSWYIPNPEVMEQATRVSFDDFIGVPVELDPSGIAGLSKSTIKPGAIMQVFMNPSPGYIGYSDPKTAAINQQGFRTYARLSSINAKNTNYLPNDVTTMILAMGELISMFSLAQRAYGLLWSYNIRNRTMPTLLLDAAGVKASELRAKAAPYLIRLNTLIVEANKIPFPSNIDYFKKCAQIYSSVYRDSNSDMSELYVPLPATTWDLNEDELTSGTYLGTHDLFGVGVYEPMDPDTLLDIIEDKINKMLTSATYNYVYSDIINLATKDASVTLLQLQPIDFGYTVVPVSDAEWLLKIKNATILGNPLLTADQLHATSHTNENDVIPDVDTLSLIYAPQFVSMEPSLCLDKLISFQNDSPSMEERLVATRYYNVGPLERADELAVAPITPYAYYTKSLGVAMGEHYITGICIYTDDIECADLIIGHSGIIGTADISHVSILTRFSQHPLVYEFDMETPSMMQSIEGLLGDLDFFTNMDWQTIQKVNKLALFAMFDVKDVTKDR